MNLKSDQCSFEIDVLLKTSQPGKHLNKVVIAAYPGNKNLCPVQHLKSYLEKTSTLRGKHTQLFVSFRNHTILFQPTLLQGGLKLLCTKLE
jgi:hypothetical protein